jgi:hypothetical protein
MKRCYSLEESTLGRVYQHVMGSSGITGWGMITAYRGANSKKENVALNKQLAGDIRSKNLGYFPVEGVWVECQDSTIDYQDCPKDKLKKSIEVTYFVPNITKSDIHLLCKKYNQDAVVYSGTETEGSPVLIFKNGSTTRLGKFNANKVAQAYSAVKNRTFSFANEENSTLLKTLIPPRYR